MGSHHMARNQKLRLKPVAAAVSAALLMGASPSVFAQDAEAADILEEVVVTGIRDSMRDNITSTRVRRIRSCYAEDCNSRHQSRRVAAAHTRRFRDANGEGLKPRSAASARFNLVT
jgi:hypothetical protein